MQHSSLCVRQYIHLTCCYVSAKFTEVNDEYIKNIFNSSIVDVNTSFTSTNIGGNTSFTSSVIDVNGNWVTKKKHFNNLIQPNAVEMKNSIS